MLHRCSPSYQTACRETPGSVYASQTRARRPPLSMRARHHSHQAPDTPFPPAQSVRLAQTRDSAARYLRLAHQLRPLPPAEQRSGWRRAMCRTTLARSSSRATRPSPGPSHAASALLCSCRPSELASSPGRARRLAPLVASRESVRSRATSDLVTWQVRGCHRVCIAAQIDRSDSSEMHEYIRDNSPRSLGSPRMESDRTKRRRPSLAPLLSVPLCSPLSLLRLLGCRSCYPFSTWLSFRPRHGSRSRFQSRS